jgi:hypothetical protein
MLLCFNPKEYKQYQSQKQNDISLEGIITHELGHLALDHPEYSEELREETHVLGEVFAEIARNKFGPKDKPLQPFEPSDAYSEYEEITRTMLLLDSKYPGCLKQLHRALQDGSYTENTLSQLTSPEAAAIWKAYIRIRKQEASRNDQNVRDEL